MTDYDRGRRDALELVKRDIQGYSEAAESASLIAILVSPKSAALPANELIKAGQLGALNSLADCVSEYLAEVEPPSESPVVDFLLGAI